jgi:hypothetical protein
MALMLTGSWLKRVGVENPANKAKISSHTLIFFV